MDTPEILEAILQQLPLNTLLACTLVSRQWHTAAHSLIQRSHLAVFEEQLDSLRCFALNRSTTGPTNSFFYSLPLLTNLVSLTISPDARISPDQINKRTSLFDPNQPCLAALLPNLNKLRHLYIHGQDLRLRGNAKEGNAQLGGTDAALLSFAASRSTKPLPGLKTLSIVSSPDLTDAGLVGYLNTTLSCVEDPQDHPFVALNGQYTLGNSLVSLTLVNCPLVTVQSLQALGQNCKNILQLDLRNVDGFFNQDRSKLESTDLESAPSPQEMFTSFIETNTSIHTFTFSSGLDSLPSDLFSSFNTPRSALQNLNISSSKAIRTHHLMNFPTIYRLSISGCSNLGDDLPFEYMPRLQEFSFLGRGLSLQSLWKLFNNGKIRKLTLDVAGSAYEACICSERDVPLRGEKIPQSVRGSTMNSINEDGESKQEQSFPPALKNFQSRNILSSTIPSWVIAFFIASSPESLESISLHGVIEPTCCSFGSSLLNAPSPVASRPSTHLKNNWNYRHLLPTAFEAIPFLRLFPFSSKAMITRVFDGHANAILSRLPFKNLQGVLTGLSARYSLLDIEDIDTLEMKIEGSSNDNNGEHEPEVSIDRYADTSITYENPIQTSKNKRASNRTRERSLSISSVMQMNKKTKSTRRALQRSASELMTGREQTISSCGGKEAGLFNLDRSESVERTQGVEERDDSSGSALQPSASLDSRTANRRIVTPNDSAQTIANDKQVALVQLLAISTNKDSTSQAASPQSMNKTLSSRLNAQQIEWLLSTTQGRILRLEL